MGKVDRVTSLNRATGFLAEIDHALIANDVRRNLLETDLQARLVESVFPLVEDGNGPGAPFEPHTGYFSNPHATECGEESYNGCVRGWWGNGGSYSLVDGTAYEPDEPFVHAVWRASGFFTSMRNESAGNVSADHAIANLQWFPDLYGDSIWGKPHCEWVERYLLPNDEANAELDVVTFNVSFS